MGVNEIMKEHWVRVKWDPDYLKGWVHGFLDSQGFPSDKIGALLWKLDEWISDSVSQHSLLDSDAESDTSVQESMKEYERKRTEAKERLFSLGCFKEIPTTVGTKFKFVDKECNQCAGTGLVTWDLLNGQAGHTPEEFVSDDTLYTCDECNGTGRVIISG